MNNPATKQEGTNSPQNTCQYCDGDHTGRTEAENKHFIYLVRTYGVFELERRVHKLKSYKLYDRAYPYDVADKAIDIEVMYNLASESIDPLTAIIDQEAFDRAMNKLTPKQQEHARLYMAGYKPREIADMEGRATSNAVRWQRHSSKERLAN